MSIVPFEKWSRMFKIIAQHGGPFHALVKLWKMDTLKEGKYMGSDAMGNRYYENKNYMISRSRWVEFNPDFRFEYDASQVTPEWFGWLHYKTDRLPTEDWAKYCMNCCAWSQIWLLPAQENLSGTEFAYYPYTTTRTKISPWDGKRWAKAFSSHFVRSNSDIDIGRYTNPQ